MNQRSIVVGGLYSVRLRGREIPVMVEKINPAVVPIYDVRDLRNGLVVSVRGAGRFVRRLTPADVRALRGR